MSFDTLTIIGILAAVLSGGFLVALVARNDAGSRKARGLIGGRDSAQGPSHP